MHLVEDGARRFVEVFVEAWIFASTEPAQRLDRGADRSERVLLFVLFRRLEDIERERAAVTVIELACCTLCRGRGGRRASGGSWLQRACGRGRCGLRTLVILLRRRRCWCSGGRHMRPRRDDFDADRLLQTLEERIEMSRGDHSDEVTLRRLLRAARNEGRVRRGAD